MGGGDSSTLFRSSSITLCFSYLLSCVTETMPAPTWRDCRIVPRIKDVQVCRTGPGTEEDLRGCEPVSLWGWELSRGGCLLVSVEIKAVLTQHFPF